MKQYILFGSDACKLYAQYGLDSLIEWCKVHKCDFYIYTFDKELANDADRVFTYGYIDYVILDKEEFLILKNEGLC